MHTRVLFQILVPVVLGVGNAYAQQPSSAPSRADTGGLPGRVIDVQAGEFYFRTPDTIPAGLTTFRLHQAGMVMDGLRAGAQGRSLVAGKDDATRGMHTLSVVRLEDGKTVGDLHRAARAGEPNPVWAKQMGGPGFTFPPRTTNATLDLEPGNYALVCYTGSAQDDRTRFHFLNGMYRALTVAPTTSARVPAPRADVVALITGNGNIRFSPSIAAGSQVLRVENATDRNLQFKFHRVSPGMTGQEFLAGPAGDGPTTPWGGLSEIPPRSTLTTTIDFEPGEYIVSTRISVRHATSQVVAVVAKRP